MSSSAHPISSADPGSATDPSRARDELRRQMRAQRRLVTAAQQKQVGRQLARWIARAHVLRAGAKVGMYLPQGREADLSHAIKVARARGCRLFLPFITHYRRRRMEFVEFPPGAALRENVYGILEPVGGIAAHVPARHLDLILLPVVAVDARGWRLGSGAGFYDRRLSHLRRSRRWRRPKLIAVAYDFQRFASLTPSQWDVPVHAVITESGFHPLRPWTD